MATMKDVAKAAGVSTATVSSTLSGASYVSPELRARVVAAVEALGYEPNSMASGLKRGKTSLIGLVVSDITNPFFTEFVGYIQNLARQAGYSIILGISDHDLEREAELLRFMRAQRVEGTILCPVGAIEDYGLDRLRLGAMKLVAVDNASSAMGFDTVSLNNHQAARLAVDHILSFGHRRIGRIGGPANQTVGRERDAGFRAAMTARGLAEDPLLVRRGDFRIAAAAQSCRELLEQSDRPTALFVANNLMLIGVMQVLAEAGLSVPRDISVASIDDFPWASAFQPALTVVRQPIEEMAAATLDLLIRRMAGDERPPLHLVLEPDLIVRQSCAAPRKS